MDAPLPALREVRRRQSGVVRTFLRVVLGVALLTIGLNVGLLGSAGLRLASLAPNLTLVAVVGVALVLERRGRFEPAVSLVAALFLIAVAIPAVAVGIESSGAALVLLFVPVALVGLVLSRPALHLASGTALAIVLVPPLLREAGALPSPAGAEPAWTVALQYALVLVILTFFLDRFGTTLREALLTSVDREAALEREVQERRQAQVALQDEKGFSDVVVASLPGVFCVLAPDGRFVRWNEALGEVLGYDDAEIAGLRWHDLVDRPEEETDAALARVLREGGRQVDMKLVAKDGRRLAHLVTGTRLSMTDRAYVAVVGLDTRELTAARTRIEELAHDLQRRLDHITALREIDRTILGSMDLDLTLRVVLQQVRRQLGVDAACVLLYRPRARTLRMAGGLGFRHGNGEPLTFGAGEGLAGRIALHRERIVIDDPDELARAFPPDAPVRREGFAAYVGVPLVAQGRLHGVLELFHRSPLEADEEWTSFLDTLSGQVAIALSSAVMLEDLERSNAELRMAYDTTIEGWARALDLRDEETEGHSRRVTDTTVRLAEAMGLDEEAIVQARRGALLHDIGKMGVPDSILRKPGRLDDDEWEAMQRHPRYAFELLSPIDFLRPALDIPYAHHERWDGSGYPRGLRGEQIPLAARIFAVADVYDALTSDRPYRRAWSPELALQHIADGAGSHFDPAVVEAFLGMMSATR